MLDTLSLVFPPIDSQSRMPVYRVFFFFFFFVVKFLLNTAVGVLENTPMLNEIQVSHNLAQGSIK